MNIEGNLITTGENVEELQLFNMTPPPPPPKWTISTTRIPETLGNILHLNKIKPKRLSNHLSQYFIHNGT